MPIQLGGIRRGGTGTERLEAYARTSLPRAGQRGRRALLTDSVGGTVRDSGTQWVHERGDVINVMDAPFDALPCTRLTDAAMTSGSGVLTSASAAFTSDDVGKTIIVMGAGNGAGNQPLVSTISTRDTATQVTLAANAVATVSGKVAYYGSAANATGLNEAFAEAGDRGGIVHVPRLFIVSGVLSGLADAEGLRVVANTGPVEYGADAAGFIYTGSGVSDFIQAKSTKGLLLSGLTIEYATEGWAGNLVALDHSASGNDTVNWRISDCKLGGIHGQNMTSANAAVNAARAIVGTLQRCDVTNVQYGIIGVNPSNGNYSIKNTVRENKFIRVELSPVLGPGESWRIVSNDFQALRGGNAGAISMFNSSQYAYGLDVRNNWCGDVTTGAGTWFTLRGRGLEVRCNTFTGGGVGIQLQEACDSVDISHNAFRDTANNLTTLIELGTSPATRHTGVKIGRNYRETNVLATATYVSGTDAVDESSEAVRYVGRIGLGQAGTDYLERHTANVSGGLLGVSTGAVFGASGDVGGGSRNSLLVRGASTAASTASAYHLGDNSSAASRQFAWVNGWDGSAQQAGRLYLLVGNALNADPLTTGSAQAYWTSNGGVRVTTLGVGNSAAATGPVGSITQKIQVYDKAGNSLGYVPVYDAIT